MNGLCVLIPARSFATAKRRLAAVLEAEARVRLAKALLAHTIGEVREAAGEATIAAVSRDEAVGEFALGAGCDAVHAGPVDGLNAELTDAARAFSAGCDVMVVLPDLPFLQAADIRAMLATQGDIVIAPDHTGRGTNAMLLRRGAEPIFAFGQGSFPRHLAAAHKAGLTVGEVRRAGVACDLDDEEDWGRTCDKVYEAPAIRRLGIVRAGAPE